MSTHEYNCFPENINKLSFIYFYVLFIYLIEQKARGGVHMQAGGGAKTEAVHPLPAGR